MKWPKLKRKFGEDRVRLVCSLLHAEALQAFAIGDLVRGFAKQNLACKGAELLKDEDMDGPALLRLAQIMETTLSSADSEE